jgi:DNA-binding transcriptional LysR family regulator
MAITTVAPQSSESRGAITAASALDLKALALAAAVAREGSIRGAARLSGLTAPSLSKRIRGLEDWLGVSVFERRSSGLRPTEAGAHFLAAADQALADLEIAISRARDAGAAMIGRVVVGSYFSSSFGRFRDTLAQFVAEHRHIHLRVAEGCRPELLAAVRDGHADVALLLCAGCEPELEFRSLWHEIGMVALPHGHPLAQRQLVRWAELVNETFIVTRLGSGPEARKKVEELLPSSRTAQFVQHDVGREGMFNLVGAGLGLAVLAESASGATYPGVVFRPVGDARGPTLIEAAAYWDPKRDNPALRRFLAQLRTTQGSRVG